MTAAAAYSGDVQVADRSVALIVACARNRVIGLGGAMPWHVPGDLKTFRRLTMGRPIIMGRKTFQSIGRALDGRTNIVVTRDPDFEADGIELAASLPEALVIARNAPSVDNCTMVIGGGEVYRSALSIADTIYMTQIEADPEGDTWFPPLDQSIWAETSRDMIDADPRDQYAAKLIVYDRIV